MFRRIATAASALATQGLKHFMAPHRNAASINQRSSPSMKHLSAAAVAATAIGLLAPMPATSQSGDWETILAEARGQTVYWHAWGGDPRINAFIDWIGGELTARHGVALVHVKLADTSDAVTRVIAEAGAGQTDGGAVDAIWINGANFVNLKERGFLLGPFTEDLPNWPLVDTEVNPAVLTDFTVPVEGYGAPWAMFRMVFEYDAARVPEPPRSLDALASWIAENPGRFTYPQPPDYLGTSFLKQVLHDVLDDPSILLRDVGEVDYEAATAPLWAFLDEITPNLWRGGAAYPANEPGLGQLLADGEIDIGFSFAPGRASAAIADGELPESVRTFVFEAGTLGNASFLSIPFNASAREGALVLANLILDPGVQARAQDPDVLGWQTVLGLDRLDAEDRARFDALELGIATLRPEAMGVALDEPHPSWTVRVAEDWIARYGVAN
jgi:putative thiamine transport system substrate-binding protein